MAKKRTSIGGDDGSGGQEGTVTVPFEEAMKHLENAVRKLEDGALGLEDSLKVFEEGIQWSRQCHHRLADAERKVEMLLKTDREELTQVAFDLGEEGDG
ncbi:MAG: exodeoxyribonuclease VII small subunit [SAR324 cluster bacterium]|nr:exodeoxyribonuclease VII small subunit [SAR324 cluster bacterium]MCH8885103.1 exodeoxyribonuclease VII small subunit [SAR324 cluster bacterium]